MPRTIVVTGASSGLGLAAAVRFAQLGDQVAVVGRNPARLDEAVARVRAAGGPAPGRFQADFEVLDDVRRLAGELREAYPRIDVLANNAGGMVGDYRRTVDGFEATVQSNHLAPFLLTELLGDRLTGARVVSTASEAHRSGGVHPDDFTGSAGSYNSWRAYGAGKAANVLFAAELARRRPDVVSVSFHPGVVRTNFGAGPLVRLFWRYAPFLTSAETAGDLLVWLATTPAAELVNGAYYVKHRPRTPASGAADPALAARLWEASRAATGV